MFEIRMPSDLAARYRQLTGQAPIAPAPEVKGASGGTSVVVPSASAVLARARMGVATTPVSAPVNAAATLNLLQTQASAEQSSAPELQLALKQAIFNALDANRDGTLTRSEVEQMYAATSVFGGSQADPSAFYDPLDPEGTGGVTLDQFTQNFQFPGAPTGTETLPTAPTATPAPTAQDALDAIMTNVEASADPAMRLKQAIFNYVDTSGEGQVTAASLEQAVTAAGGSAESAAALYSQLDPEGTDSVSAQQFTKNLELNQIVGDGVSGMIELPAAGAVNALTQAAWVPAMASPPEVSNPFSAVDTNNDGTATQAEVEQAVMASGGTTETADALYTNLDPEGTGSVTADQFAANMPTPAVSYYDSFFGVTIDTGPPTDAQLGMQAVYQTMATDSDPIRQFTKGLFGKLDANADGALTQSEVEQSVVAAGSTAEAANALYAQLDPQAAGSVSMQQFVAGLPRPDLSADKARELSNALRPLPSVNQLAQSASARTTAGMSTSMMSVLLQAQSTAS